jgi:hypothetical protein
MHIVRTALDAMCTAVTGPTLFDPLEQSAALEVAHAT